MIPLSEPDPRADASDPERLAALHALDILDTVSEEGFDDAVQIARLICQTPVALVSFVGGDRQWFKARVGFPDCQTDLDRSVCVHALAEPDLLVIPDLTADRRTRANPLVVGEPRIRFYAGAPLRMPGGHVVGSLCVIDHQPRPDGLSQAQANALRCLARQVVILLRERGHVVKMEAAAVLAQAATARRLALIELGDELRDLSEVAAMTTKAAEIVGRTLNTSRAGYGELDLGSQTITIPGDWTEAGERSLTGRHTFAAYGLADSVIQGGETVAVADVADDPRTADSADALRAANIGAQINIPVRERGRSVGLFFVHAASPRTWLSEEIAFARNVADRVQVGIARLRAEEQQAMLNHELSHRMKNTLAMVQAITTQTLRNAVDLEAARETLGARLLAMGKAHDLVLTGRRESASLEAVIRGALAIHDDARTGRLRLSGPYVHLGSRAALSLALIVHELATNAGKYGALSVPDGYVAVAWEIDRTGPEPIIRMAWREHGGPPVTAPARRGFGTRLIERGLAGAFGGEARLTYEREGLACDLSATLAGIEAES